MQDKHLRRIPISIGLCLCLLILGFVLYNAKATTRSQTKESDLALVEHSLQQFDAARTAAIRYQETDDPTLAKQVSENIEKAGETLNAISDFNFAHLARTKLTMNVYFRYGHGFRFAVQCGQTYKQLETEWNKRGWEALFLSLEEMETREIPYLAEIRQIRVETDRLFLRRGDLASLDKELADGLLRDIEQRCKQSIDRLEKLREQAATEEEQETITNAINCHKSLLGMSKTLAQCYTEHRSQWEALDTIAVESERIGDEFHKYRSTCGF